MSLLVAILIGITVQGLSLRDIAFLGSQSGGGGGGGGGSPTYLIKQGFEGAGYDNGETWTETGSNINEDYTATVLDGSESCIITQSTSAEITVASFSATDEVWAYALVRPVAIDTGTARDIIVLRNDTTFVASLRAGGASSKLSVVNGSTATTVAAISAGTTYHIWLHFVKGTGANAIVDVGFSTDGIRPTSGDNFAQITDGSATLPADKIQLGRNSTITQTYIFDKVRVDDVQIGDNPE